MRVKKLYFYILVNALVNYTNRSGGNDMPVSTVMRNFAAATTLAGGVALGKLDESRPTA